MNEGRAGFNLVGRQFTTFLTVGLVNSGLTYLIYLTLSCIMPYTAAFSVSYAIGIVISYWANSTFSFAAALGWRQALAFATVQFLTYSVSLTLVVLLVEYLSIAVWLAPLIVAALMVCVNFALSRRAIV